MSAHRLTQTDASLNPPVPEMVDITIDGIELKAPKGENIIEAAKRAGIDIPFFCYHPRLSKGDAANCRMCLVDVSSKAPDGSVRKMPKPQTACTLPAAQGMIIDSSGDRVVKDRRGILEFLLINHPLDCPVCDRGGECPLQNNTLFYGPPVSRYVEEKRHLPKAYPLSEHVVFDRERCIHCARCTRFTEDISGDTQLGFLKRGADMEVGTFARTQFHSKFSGNVIEICPVGALLSKPYRFAARPWDLHSQRSICTRCSNGCNIKLDYRLDRVARVNARLNEEVNEEWTCDKGKFYHDYVRQEERLQAPLLKRNGEWTSITWADAYSLLMEKLSAAGGSVGAIGGSRCTNEDNYALQRLFRDVLKSSNLDCRLGRYQGPGGTPLFKHLSFQGMGNAIADLEKMRSIFVLGSDLAEEQPILFLRVRKAWRFHNAAILNAASDVPSESTQVGDFADLQLIYRPGQEPALLRGIAASMLQTQTSVSVSPADAEKLKSAAGDWTTARAAHEAGLTEQELAGAASLLAKGPMAILAGRSVTEHPEYEQIAKLLADIAAACGAPANVNVPGSGCNTQGAMDMGILPDCLPGGKQAQDPGMSAAAMLAAAAASKLQVLWLVGAKPIENYHDTELARNALSRCPFVVASELYMTDSAREVDLILPAAGAAEKDGTFTNCESRVQRIYRAFEPIGSSKPDWLIYNELSARMGADLGYISARDIFRDICAAVAGYESLSYRSLGEFGSRLA
ncbi:MAG TPA: NADH-quinone oxidoreductase subunit NuoG [Chthonomonadales bacterium]|nr:NADH-quinone oxidoreductase subunit NuoG [Chthonomonadales bacterium]